MARYGKWVALLGWLGLTAWLLTPELFVFVNLTASNIVVCVLWLWARRTAKAWRRVALEMRDTADKMEEACGKWREVAHDNYAESLSWQALALGAPRQFIQEKH